MSHGGGGEDNIEPDLTPLLDLVLQLLMFFIINVNFVAEQVSSEVKLPRSGTARPVNKADPGAIFVSQMPRSTAYMNKLPKSDYDRLSSADSIILVPNVRPMSPPEAKAWLRDKHEELVKLNGGRPVDTIVQFRPDEDLDYGEMVRLMEYCKVAGFTKIKLRAKITRPGA